MVLLSANVWTRPGLWSRIVSAKLGNPISMTLVPVTISTSPRILTAHVRSANDFKAAALQTANATILTLRPRVNASVRPVRHYSTTLVNA